MARRHVREQKIEVEYDLMREFRHAYPSRPVIYVSMLAAI